MNLPRKPCGASTFFLWVDLCTKNLPRKPCGVPSFFCESTVAPKTFPENRVAGKVCRTANIPVSLVETGTHAGMHAAETFGQKTGALVGTSLSWLVQCDFVLAPPRRSCAVSNRTRCIRRLTSASRVDPIWATKLRDKVAGVLWLQPRRQVKGQTGFAIVRCLS